MSQIGTAEGQSRRASLRSSFSTAGAACIIDSGAIASCNAATLEMHHYVPCSSCRDERRNASIAHTEPADAIAWRAAAAAATTDSQCMGSAPVCAGASNGGEQEARNLASVSGFASVRLVLASGNSGAARPSCGSDRLRCPVRRSFRVLCAAQLVVRMRGTRAVRFEPQSPAQRWTRDDHTFKASKYERERTHWRASTRTWEQ